MEILIKAAQLVTSLAILVTLHEFGHFIPAKLFKTRVEKFYLFFNPYFSFFRWKKVNGNAKKSWLSKEAPESWSEDPDTTEWGIGWVPLGGYVKIAGMIDESLDTEQLKQDPQPWEFRSKKAWQRLIIMIGGVTVNLVLGFIIYIGVVFTWGQLTLDQNKLQAGLSVHPYLSKYGIHSGDKVLSIEGKTLLNLDELNKGVLLRGTRNLTIQHPDGSTQQIQLPADIDQKLFEAGALPAFGLRSNKISLAEVNSDSPAQAAGLKPTDRILAVDGQSTQYYDEFQAQLFSNKNQKVALKIAKKGNLNDTCTVNVQVTPAGTIGVLATSAFVDKDAISEKKYGFGQSIGIGMSYGYHTLADYVSQFKFVFTKKGATQIGGFASIGNMFPPLWDWHTFWLTTALLSIILAFMNILPIPALDGGHVVFLLYEMITRKEAPQKVLEVAQYIGIFLLLSLMIYANGADLVRWLIK
ncbi:MAG: metalloprotease RseP [Bacteroidota bacterium]|jgi:regulator of sigma E protease